MNRRGAISLAAAGAVALAAPASAQTRKTITLGSVWPAADARSVALRRLAQRVAAMTDGSVVLEPLDVSGGVPQRNAYRLVADDDIGAVLAQTEMWRDTHPAHALFTSAPGGLTIDEFEGWLAFNGGLDLWRRLSADDGIVPFLMGDLGQALLWSRGGDPGAPGASVAARGLSSDLWEAIGVPTAAPANADMVEASTTELQAQGTRFRELIQASFSRPMNALVLAVNGSAVAALSETERDVMLAATRAEHVRMRAEHRVQGQAVLADWPRSAVRAAPEGQVEAQNAAAVDLIAALADHDALAAEIVNAYGTQLKAVRGWSDISTGAYSKSRREALAQ